MNVEKKILVILPAYNEEDSIVKVIEDVEKNIPSADILVVNDGSSDNTSILAKQKNVFVIDLPFNLGIGAAVQTGFKFAYENNYDIAVQCDGDGQHPPYQINKIITDLEKHNVDIIVGSRFLIKYSYKSTIIRIIGIFIISKIVSFILKMRITDPTSGFRAFSKRSIKFFSIIYPQDYPEPESLILAFKGKLKIKEVPIRINIREKGCSSINIFRGIYYMVKVILAIIIDIFEKIPTI